MKYTITHENPLPEEYCHLRKITGLSPKTIEAAIVSLPHSLFAITIRDEGKLIAMGRIIGDLGCFVQIVDIAVPKSAIV